MKATAAELLERIRILVEKGRLPNGDQPMVVATASKDGIPSARYVLLKAIEERGLVFYTNLESHKGTDLAGNARAELLFYWPAQMMQLRVGGRTEEVDRETADEYWRLRDRESQLASAASPQSQPIEPAALRARVEELRHKFHGKDVPRPTHWTGVRVVPDVIEFWKAGEHRLHDREQWRRGADAWTGTTIAP